MPGFPSPFGRDEEELFDEYEKFVPENIPSPDRFLEGHDVLEGRDHIEFHRTAQEVFEERKVYDMTFNYNLARLNLDTRHPNAGYRYAEEDPTAEDAMVDADLEAVLRAEFTPTTPFCPQTHTLTIGSFRAWNGLSDRHDYDLVRVRSSPMHHQSEAINEQLAELEEKFVESGDEMVSPQEGSRVGSNPMERAKRNERPSRGSSDAPF
ncbi:MAG: hypothetical protein ABEJ27_05245 [Halodesulfurarchaeum sp.]